MLVVLPLLGLVLCALGQPDPKDYASRVASQIVNNKETFFRWEYGGALIFDGLWETAQHFPSIDYTPLLDSTLDAWAADPTSFGYKILNDIAIPWSTAIGDTVGLFPIAYLNRFITESNATALALAVRVAAKYILGWPTRLKSGLVSRNEGWPGQQGHDSFIWGDDQYMGLTLVARLAVLLERQDYAEFVASQAVLFSDVLRTRSGVYAHGYNDATHQQSCCQWGRANGWALLSHIEAWKSVRHFAALSEEADTMRAILIDHVESIVPLQGPDGRWHQLLNDSTTFLETSCTAMFLASITEGIQAGVLDEATYRPVADRAWVGLTSTITTNGTVTGICEGTGIQPTPDAYRTRPTDYLHSGPGGLGAVLRAAVAYDKLLHGLGPR
eukprot:m.78805 g.78805  ORF g.78805 m.78805 type:complete len:385 (-) comp13258_c0_seq2:66-1220(-)